VAAAVPTVHIGAEVTEVDVVVKKMARAVTETWVCMRKVCL